MKKSILLFVVFALSFISVYSQMSVVRTVGSSFTTDIGYGIKINEGSSLKKEKIIINDALCPIQLNGDVGIEISTRDRAFAFNPSGSFNVKEPIVAYEMHHIIYDIFGDHIKTLSNTQVADIVGQQIFTKYDGWYASENNVSEYLISVSYVANVRTQSGQIWHYNFIAIKDQLDILKISFEESYIPEKDIDDDK